MNSKRRFALLILFGSFILATIPQTFAGPIAANSQTHTPIKGSEERKAIMEVLRVMVRKMSGLEVVFVVHHLKVNKDWAWVEAEPASADGSQHYETVTGLLQRKNGHWKYVEGPPELAVCEEDPDCADTGRYFRKLARKYPAASAEIYPKQ